MPCQYSEKNGTAQVSKAQTGVTDLLDRVGPDGTVFGIDVSTPMLEVARDRLAATGLGNVQLVHADAQSHAFPGLFDVAISRFGTMFFTDPVAAFTTLAAGMRSGARLVLATWPPCPPTSARPRSATYVPL